MKLFYTDKEFIVGGVAKPGIPFLCDEKMELMTGVNLYLRYVALIKGRTRSPRTWATYGMCLYEYFSFLEANNFSWQDIEPKHVASWRDAMLDRNCKRTTVNQRLRCVHAFYLWATRSGLVNSIPFSSQEIWVSKPRGFLAHIDVRGNRTLTDTLTLQTYTPTPDFLPIDQALQFCDALSPERLRLMAYMMLLMGMRRDEVVGFDYRALPNPAGQDPQRQIPMLLDASITPTKGGKTRTVMVPYDLCVALYAYFTFKRPKLAKLFKQKNGKETSLLFLSKNGDPLSSSGVNSAFRKVSTKTNISCHPHVLRHTFATYELLRMSKQRNRDWALLWVKERLGHSSITTTERYVHATNLITSDAVDSYQEDICEALRNGH